MTYTSTSGNRSLLEGMAPTRRDILVDLKMHQGGTVEDLAEHLHLSPGAVRHQLALLAAEGFVRFEGVPRDGRGRRPRDYQLTRKGDDLFPTTSAELALKLLNRVRRSSAAAMQEALKAEMEEMGQAAAFAVQSEDPEERLEEIVRVYEERFFYPSVEDDEEDGAPMLCTNHCPMYAVVESLPDVCDVEMEMVRRAFPESEIELVEHRPRGDSRCAFKINHPVLKRG
jgi:DeoR family transcriptional regulator, suf operon transcriptional repressor